MVDKVADGEKIYGEPEYFEGKESNLFFLRFSFSFPIRLHSSPFAAVSIVFGSKSYLFIGTDVAISFKINER